MVTRQDVTGVILYYDDNSGETIRHEYDVVGHHRLAVNDASGPWTHYQDIAKLKYDNMQYEATGDYLGERCWIAVDLERVEDSNKKEEK